MEPEILRLALRQVLTRGRVLTFALLLALPPFLAALYAASDSSLPSGRFLTRVCDGLVLTTVMPIIALVLGGAALGNEVEDGTLIYLVMKPIARWRIVLAKLAVAAVVVAVLSSASVLAATLITSRDGDTVRAGLAFAAGTVAGALAYTSAFVFLGLVTSRTLVVGLLYIFIWEGALASVFTGLRGLSVRQFARAIAEQFADLPRSTLNVPTSFRTGVIGVITVVALGFLLSVWRLRDMDVE